MSDLPFDDPVVEEIHAIRAEMLAECGGDLRVLLGQVNARQDASGRNVTPAPAKPPTLAGKAGRANDTPAS